MQKISTEILDELKCIGELVRIYEMENNHNMDYIKDIYDNIQTISESCGRSFLRTTNNDYMYDGRIYNCENEFKDWDEIYLTNNHHIVVGCKKDPNFSVSFLNIDRKKNDTSANHEIHMNHEIKIDKKFNEFIKDKNITDITIIDNICTKIQETNYLEIAFISDTDIYFVEFYVKESWLDFITYIFHSRTKLEMESKYTIEKPNNEVVHIFSRNKMYVLSNSENSIIEIFTLCIWILRSGISKIHNFI